MFYRKICVILSSSAGVLYTCVCVPVLVTVYYRMFHIILYFTYFFFYNDIVFFFMLFYWSEYLLKVSSNVLWRYIFIVFTIFMLTLLGNLCWNGKMEIKEIKYGWSSGHRLSIYKLEYRHVYLSDKIVLIEKYLTIK